VPIKQSRLSLARAAIRPAMKGRVLLSGPSGAGKTFSALVIAETLAGADGRIVLIDTEKESALTYADKFRFEHLRWNPPFDPQHLAATILEAGETYDVVIVDSFTHFWRKQGGTLDIAGGKFTGWKEARPVQEDVQDAILETGAHVIACCRMKQEHVQETDDRGKHHVRKLGMKIQQDDDFEYEVNVALEVDMNHVLSVSKSRTMAVPVGAQFPQGHAGDFAVQYRDWLAGGENVASQAVTEELAALLNGISDAGERNKAKHLFLDAFGRPEFLLESLVDEARQWCVDRAAGVAEPADRAEDATPPVDEPETDDKPTGVVVPPTSGATTETTTLPGDARDDGQEADRVRLAAAQAVAKLSTPKVVQRLAELKIDPTDNPRARLIDALVATPNGEAE
jgi:hypothetical protein